MIKEDILGGLKLALSKGYSLKEAMLSFYNAGYERNEIEEAARKVQAEIVSRGLNLGQAKSENKVVPKKILPAKNKPFARSLSSPLKPLYQKQQTDNTPKPSYVSPQIKPSKILKPPEQSKKILQPTNVKNKKPNQISKEEKVTPKKQVFKNRVSAYTSSDNKIKEITIILVILLIILFGILGVMFIFKDQVIKFFNSLF